MAECEEMEKPMNRPEDSQSCSTEQISEPDDLFSSHTTNCQLPVYIKNMFLACGYDTSDVIAEMDACPTTNPNDIDRMLDYVAKSDFSWGY